MRRAAIWSGALAFGLFTLAALTLRVWAPPAMFDQVSLMSLRRMVAVLESRFAKPRIDDWSKITGLVVLGGAADRLVEAFRLAEAHPHLRIIVSGPLDFEMDFIAKADAAIQERLIFETKSLAYNRNTFGNAVYSLELVAPVKGERWLLVTSASHMPRAIGTFHKIGFFVEPWPVRIHSDNVEYLAYVARHEWLGLASYWLRGRTTTFLPGYNS